MTLWDDPSPLAWVRPGGSLEVTYRGDDLPPPVLGMPRGELGGDRHWDTLLTVDCIAGTESK